MVTVEFGPVFEKKIRKIKHHLLKYKVKKQIEKVVNNPEIGKTMMYSRKGTREVYIAPFRLSYSYLKEENKIIFLDLYHKGEQ
ncbi:MAG: type II toxin-antitoxin system RelE/ParE family toxin [Nanoarchaeota archaeon]